VFEELNGALVFFRRAPGPESAEVPPPAGLGIDLPRIEPIFARCELSNHLTAPFDWHDLNKIDRLKPCKARSLGQLVGNFEGRS
jgi:hypothetical protein